MKLVVSGTSPLRALGQLELLGILPRLFESILVPSGVIQELSVDVPGVRRIDASRFAFLVVREPADAQAVAVLRERIGLGEAEALVLAIETQADVLLIDESRGRSIAKGKGVRVLGVLGLLVQAKRAGLVPEVGPLVERLEQELSFRISVPLRRRVLAAAGG